MTNTLESDAQRFARYDKIRQLLFPDLFGDPAGQRTGPQSDRDRQAASHLVSEIMAGRITPASIAELEALRRGDQEAQEAVVILSDELPPWVFDGGTIVQLARAVAAELTQARTRVGELDAELKRAPRLRDGVDPFVLELDTYRTALSELYRKVYEFPEGVPVDRTGEDTARDQAQAVWLRFCSVVEQLEEAKRGDGGKAEQPCNAWGMLAVDVDGLVKLARDFLGPKR